ncbi:MAG: ABC transporter permease [Pseudomonadota bacterium]
MAVTYAGTAPVPASDDTGPLVTADGIPLKQALQHSQRRNKLKALGLVAPPFIFLVILFIVPVISLMFYSVDDRKVNTYLPKTFALYDTWDGEELPDENLYKAMFEDISSAPGLLMGQSSTRMNYAKSRWKSLIKKSNRRFKKLARTDFAGPYKPEMIKIDKRWGDIDFWRSLEIMKNPITTGYFANAVDYKIDFEKGYVAQPEYRQIYKTLWWRTFEVAILVTIFTLLLGYPVAHLLATLPARYANLLMICVLMPFWTSLLVRIVAWMVMLQQNGVVNDTLVAANVLDTENRLEMMYNYTGTIIVMTQILLPFMILPIYSVMKGISPAYMKAAQNLGATPTRAFIKVYMPQTLPGIGAGVILVFIVAIGYYITPELVGGKDGQLIGNSIANHLQQTLNWGLAAAMGVMLLAGILVLYWIYDKVVGIDNMRMG